MNMDTVMKMDMDIKKQIEGIDQIELITNGTLDEMKSITNPNEIGSVVDNTNGKHLSYITPMIMIINQNKMDYRERLTHMISNDGDMDMEINYYGRQTTAREIAEIYRNYL
jgi:hypothetical protein